jgi:PAS domain S-box-containing protein
MSSGTGIKLPPGYNTLHIGIAWYEPETGTILAANRRLEELLGYSTEQLRDISIATYTANTYSFSEEQFLNRLQAAAEGSHQEFVWRIKRADGELIWVRIYLSHQTRHGQSYVRAEIRDITDYYDTQHREELFWRILRHNLRNKTNIITAHAQQMRSSAETAQLQTVAERIHSAAMDLGATAGSVREIYQAIDSSSSERRRRAATAAVRDVVDAILAEFPDAEITITENEQMWIEVDSAFTHALRHALENAIVHSDESAPSVEVTIRPSANTGRVEICCRDTNPPITDAELTALFHRGETTNVSHGSGVGLFVMKWCIESLGGEIDIERYEPQGNTVRFYLPPQTPPLSIE